MIRWLMYGSLHGRVLAFLLFQRMPEAFFHFPYGDVAHDRFGGIYNLCHADIAHDVGVLALAISM